MKLERHEKGLHQALLSSSAPERKGKFLPVFPAPHPAWHPKQFQRAKLVAGQQAEERAFPATSALLKTPRWVELRSVFLADCPWEVPGDPSCPSAGPLHRRGSGICEMLAGVGSAGPLLWASLLAPERDAFTHWSSKPGHCVAKEVF